MNKTLNTQFCYISETKTMAYVDCFEKNEKKCYESKNNTIQYLGKQLASINIEPLFYLSGKKTVLTL